MWLYHPRTFLLVSTPVIKEPLYKELWEMTCVWNTCAPLFQEHPRSPAAAIQINNGSLTWMDIHFFLFPLILQFCSVMCYLLTRWTSIVITLFHTYMYMHYIDGWMIGKITWFLIIWTAPLLMPLTQLNKLPPFLLYYMGGSIKSFWHWLAELCWHHSSQGWQQVPLAATKAHSLGEAGMEVSGG